jgi:branched-chain amino acid transport system ATP-binding protein
VTAATASPDILECSNVSKAYGGVVAVKDVTFRVPRGKVFAVVGPNGAGKTTLFEVIAGASRPTAGSIVFDGSDVTGSSADKVCRLGLARTFQTAVGFGSMTVLGNTLIGAQFGRPDKRGLSFGFDSETVDRSREALSLCGLGDREAASTASLSVLETKRLMFANAIAAGVRMLLLDEPVGGLTGKERGELVELIRVINRRGVTILMIEHVMRVVRATADEMLVLHHGQTIAVGTPEVVLADEMVRSVYLGNPVEVQGAGGP